ncbi:MAG: AAA family ATPase [Acidimicrobiia bacterium]|nr:AAA family ATPase [Acidimicrobiia bacterium]
MRARPGPGPGPGPGQAGSGSEASDLGLVAEKCHLPVDYLEQIVDLLHDKRQIVFYGPPGTGKTFVAQELAAFLAGGSSERAILVQFHPSTSYEDFFEGIRPRTDDEGRLHYELRPGPLARVAEKARSNPDETYVVVIDEFNRANLPKVLGELLFLLEYRDREI